MYNQTMESRFIYRSFHWRLLLLSLLVLGTVFYTVWVFPVRLTGWTFSDDQLSRLHVLPIGIPTVFGRSLPAYTVLDSQAWADLDRDGFSERLALSASQAEIIKGGEVVWQSPESWKVIRLRLTDLDGDRQPEAALLVWRAFQPWPVDRFMPHGGRISSFQNAAGQSCHLILIGWTRGKFRELWAGSALADPLQDFAAADLNMDGKQELVALEGEYDDPAGNAAHSLSVWTWNGFGFNLVARVSGRFDRLNILSAPDHRLYVLTQP